MIKYYTWTPSKAEAKQLRYNSQGRRGHVPLKRLAPIIEGGRGAVVHPNVKTGKAPARHGKVYAQVYSTGSTWHYRVISGGAVVLYDNTGDYETILRAALIRVEALRHMIIAGHKLSAYEG